MPKIFISPIRSDALLATMAQALISLRCEGLFSKGTRVFIKPNFTYPFYKPGVTTSPQILEALVCFCVERGATVFIGESDGGSNAWRAEDAFAGHRVPEICIRYGAQAVNLSQLPREVVEVDIAHRKVRVELPSMLLRDIEVFITVPVPKVHVMTIVSLGFKNQWGCIPDIKRLRYHPEFDHVVLAINKLLQPELAVYDGSYFLNRTGPMEGDPVPLNLLIVSDDVGAGDLVCCEIMGISAGRVKHLRMAMREGMMPKSLAEVEINVDPYQFNCKKFILQRTPIDWLALIAFHSRVATWFFYQSKLAKPIHELLYFIRGRPKDFSPQW